LLIQFGGHEYAAGLTMDEAQFDAFRKRFNEIVQNRLCDEDFEPELLIDAEVNLHDINDNFWKILNQFEPYGPNNSKPIFVSNNLKVVGSPSKVGKDHLKLRVAQNGVQPASHAFDAIGFNLGSFYDAILESRDNGTPFSMAYTIDENTWNGRTTLQMQVKDIKIA